MIATCPSCGTRYNIKPEALGERGRTVRCSSCGERWFVAPEGAEPGAADPPAVERTTLAPVAAPAAPVEPDRRTPDPGDPFPPDLPRAEAANAELGRPEPGFRLTPPTAPPVLARPEPRDVADRRPRGRGQLAGWLTFVLVALVLAAAVVGHDQIAQRFPATVPLYQKLGISLQLDLGLELADLATSREGEPGQERLLVSGKIVNVANGARPVPPLQVAFLDGAGKELRSDPIPPPAETLAAGQRTRFEARLPAPPAEARDVKVTFAESSS